MSDPVVQTYKDSAGKTERCMQSSQSVWMAHWTRRNFDAAIQKHSCSSSLYGKKENDHDSKEYQLMSKLGIAPNISSPAKGIKGIETTTLKVGNDSLRVSSTAIRKENLGFQSFPSLSSGQNGGSISALKENGAACDTEVTRPLINGSLGDDIVTPPMRRSSIPLLPTAPDANNTPSRVFYSEPECSLEKPKGPVKMLTVFRDSDFAMSRRCPEDFTGSASPIVECQFGNKNNRTSFLPSLMGRPALASKEQLRHTNLRFLERENFDYQRHSAFLVCEEKIGSQLESERYTTAYLQKNKMPLLQTVSLASNNHSPAAGGEQLHEIENFSGIRLLQNQSKLSDTTTSEKLKHSFKSGPKFPYSHHEETMRICTTVDSVVGVRGGHPKFSQTTHSLLITKNTDYSLFKGNRNFRDSIEFAEFNENGLGNRGSLSPPSCHAQQGVKLQSLSSFTNSEEKEKADYVNALSGFVNSKEKEVDDVKVFGYSLDSKGKNVEHDMVSYSDLKNESSADTETMDLTDLEEENWHSGVNCSSLNKIIKLGSIADELNVGSAREVGHVQCKTVIPDMNLELPALPDPADELDNGDPSTSRTQSLDMETVLGHAEQLRHSDSDQYLGGSAGPDPSSRWVKRLKLSVSDSLVLGTKSSNLGEKIPHEKGILFPGRNIKGGMLSSEPTVSGRHGKELMVPGKTATSIRHGESSSMETINKDRELLISHPWIRRWCHSRAATEQKKPGPVVVCDPQSSKLSSEDLKENQFPSIAAMALMGKAMIGFQPCEFQKRGSFVVWNARNS